MGMFDFLTRFKNNVPTFSKDDINRAIAKINQSNSQFSIPAYAAAMELLGKEKMKSTEVKEVEALFHRHIKKQGAGIIDAVNMVLNNIPEILTAVQKASDDIIQSEEITEGLTFKKTVILQVIEAATFVITFSRRLLIYIYWFESNKTADGMQPTPNEINSIQSNILEFAKACIVLGMPGAELTKRLEDTVDAALTDITEANYRQMYEHIRIDPLTVSGFNVNKFPTYMIGMYFFNRSLTKYEADKEEYDYLVLAHQRLLQQKQNNPSASLDKQLLNVRERMESTWSKIKKFEES